VTLSGYEEVPLSRNEEVQPLGCEEVPLPGDEGVPGVPLRGGEQVLPQGGQNNCAYLEIRRCEVRLLFSVMIAIPPLVERCNRLPFWRRNNLAVSF
jgi:hypothetical protein